MDQAKSRGYGWPPRHLALLVWGATSLRGNYLGCLFGRVKDVPTRLHRPDVLLSSRMEQEGKGRAKMQAKGAGKRRKPARPGYPKSCS
jgi:hypothetical protein